MDHGLHIFVIEDNDELRTVLVDLLAQDGHTVTGMGCAEEVDNAVSTHPPDLYLLDLNLPGEDGLSLARRIRAAQPEAGLIMLTAREQLRDRMEGYATGADIYLNKPFYPEELVSIVRSLAKRLKGQSTAANPSQVAQLNLTEMSLRGPTGSVSLSSNESNLLLALARANSHTLETWQVGVQLGQAEHKLNKASMEVQLSRLRKKMQQVGLPEPGIKAIKGFGYRLCIGLVTQHGDATRLRQSMPEP